MATTLRELAKLVGGQLVGDGDKVIRAARPSNEAGPDDITFLENDKYVALLGVTRVGAAILPVGLTAPNTNQILVAEPLAAFIVAFRHFRPSVNVETGPRIDVRADVHPTAKIGKDVTIRQFAVIGAGCVVGDRCEIHSGVVVGNHCRLGDDVILHPNVTLYADTIIGNRVIIHANAAIGADGFGYRFQNERHIKVPQLGWVEVGDDVEIGAGSTVDRGTFSATRIGEGTKIDNLVQIAHNCQIGRHNIFVSQIGMAGSSSTGDYVMMGGQVGVVDGVHIGDRCMIGGQAAITKDVPPDTKMLGSPATEAREQMRILKSLQHLPEWRKELRTVQEKLGMAG